MPLKRRYRKRKTTKRRVYKRKRTTRPYTKFNKIPVADSLYTKLTYFNSSGVTVPGSTYSITNAGLYQTSIFDPDQALGGHQPLWFDQYCPGMYTSFRVFGIKYYINVVTRDADTAWSLFVRHANTTVLDTNPQTASERTDTRRLYGTPINSSRGMITAKGYLSITKVRGITSERVRTDPEFEGQFNVNPPAMAYLHFGLYTNSARSVAFDVSVRLVFYCKFTGRVTPGGS